MDLRVLTESGMEFQIATPILVKDFFIVSIYSFVDNHICIIIFVLMKTMKWPHVYWLRVYVHACASQTEWIHASE